MGLNLLSRALKLGKCGSSEKHLVHRKSNLNDFHSSQSEMVLKVKYFSRTLTHRRLT